MKFYKITPELQELIKLYCHVDIKDWDKQIAVLKIRLCDNEIDKDNECFSVSALYQISKLAIGKCGILPNLDTTSRNYISRIISATVVCDPERQTSYHTDYFYVEATAYLFINDDTTPILNMMKNDRISEVSVGCSVNIKNDIDYIDCDGKKESYVSLRDVTDLYEWSFVYSPETKPYIQGYQDGYKEGYELGLMASSSLIHKEGYEQAIDDINKAYHEREKEWEKDYLASGVDVYEEHDYDN